MTLPEPTGPPRGVIFEFPWGDILTEDTPDELTAVEADFITDRLIRELVLLADTTSADHPDPQDYPGGLREYTLDVVLHAYNKVLSELALADPRAFTRAWHDLLRAWADADD